MSIKQNFPVVKPTLNLDFANSETVDSRITFTRASLATYTDAQSVVQTARYNKPRIDFDPNTGECRGLLIEESRTNSMKCSDRISSYTNTPHGFVSVTVAPFAALAPDGTFSATSIKETVANDKHCIQNGFTQGAAGSYTVSIYVKPNGRTKITLREEYSYGGDIDFDLTTQTVSAGGGAWISNSGRIQSFSNGWYRISATINLSVANAYCVFDIITNSGSSTGYAGDPTKGFYAWGFQIEAGTFLTSYISTTPSLTSRASSATYFDQAGVLRTAPAGSARYGYELPYKQVDFGLDTGSNIVVNNIVPAGTVGALRPQGLILEPAATNLVTYSYNLSYLNTGYYLTTFTASKFAVTTETTAPDNTYTASKFIFTAANDRVDSGYGTVPAAGWYTLSAWLKGAAGTVVQLSLLTSAGGNVESACYLTGQWQRFSIRKYFNSGEALRVHAPIIRDTMGNSVTANTGETGVYATYVYVWGLQIEAGDKPTSYIPTYGATATRAADVANTFTVTRANDAAIMYNISSLLNKYSGSIVTEYKASSNTGGVFELLPQSGTGGIDQRVAAYVYLGDNYAVNAGTYSVGTNTKTAIGYSDTNSQTYRDGVQQAGNYVHSFVVPYYSLLIGGIDGLSAGYPLNGTIKRIVYYPKRLSNTELQSLSQ